MKTHSNSFLLFIENQELKETISLLQDRVEELLELEDLAKQLLTELKAIRNETKDKTKGE